MINRSIRSLARALAAGIKPKPPMTMLEYVEKYGYITSPSDGRQKWYTRPYQRDWFLAPTDPEVQCMVCMKPSRVGWSEYVKFVVQFFVDWRPSKLMIVQPTDEEVKKYSDEDIETMFNPAHGAPRLTNMLDNKKSRTSLKNTYNYKRLTNGSIIDIRHAGSAGSARRVNRNPILIEEPAAYAQLSEGDTLQLFLQRAGTAVDPFFTIGGTPVVPNDYMEQCLRLGDQQYRYYPCPHCGHYQELMTRGAWERFIKEGKNAGKLICENCTNPETQSPLIEYRHLRTMDSHAGWACPLEGVDRKKQILDDDGNPIWRSQQVGPGMSYHRAASWSELARRYRNALAQLRMGNPDPMQTFYNTDMGLSFEPAAASRITADGLARRLQDAASGNGYPWDESDTWEAPTGVLVITIGVDVQGGGGTQGEGLRIHVWGWGRGEESWHLAELAVDGDPQQLETLDHLDAVIASRWLRQDGAQLPVALGAIDEGGLATESVRRWCAARVGRWIPVRGLPQPNAELLGRGVAVEINAKNRAANRVGRDLMYYSVGYERSVNQLGAQLNVKFPGPGYVHFGRCTSAQTLAELFPWRRTPISPRSHQYHWSLPQGARDEAGDCRRYAYAALLKFARAYPGPDVMWPRLEAAALRSLAPPQPPAPVPQKTSWLESGATAGVRTNWLRR